MRTSLVILTALFMCIGFVHGDVGSGEMWDGEMWNCLKGDDGFAFQLRTYDSDYKTVACDGVLTVDFFTDEGSSKATGTRIFNVSKEDYTQVTTPAIPMFNVPAKKYLEWESEKIRYDELPEGRPVYWSSVDWPIRCTFEEHGGKKVNVTFQGYLILTR